MSILDRFFSPSYDKILKEIQPSVDRVNAAEEKYVGLSDTELIETVAALKQSAGWFHT